MDRTKRLSLCLCLALASCRKPAPPSPLRLVVALPAGASSLTPWTSNEEFTYSILRNVYEPLVDLDADLAAVPGLADSWENPDELTWVFRLREGVRLHDGRALEASEVAQALLRARDDPQSRRTSEINAVRAAEAPNPRTVVLRTEKPCGPLPNRISGILLAFDSREPGGRPVGSGPYRVRSWTANGDVQLAAFEGYRDGRPAIDEVVFRAVSDPHERVGLLQHGTADLVIDVPAEDFARLRDLPGVRTVAGMGLRTLYLGPDCTRRRNPDVDADTNPFADVRVRRALALAIDREGLVRGPLGAHADVVDQLVPTEVFGYHERLRPRLHDPAGARRLLAEAGYPRGFGVRLDFPVRRYRAIEAVVGFLVQDLAAVGIRVTPRPAEMAVFGERVDEKREFALYLAGWLNSNGDAAVAYDYIVHTPRSGFGLYNSGRYSSPAVDRLLEEALAKIPPQERKVLLAAVAERVYEDVPVIPLYRQRDLYAFSDRLRFEPRLDRRIRADRIRWK